MSIKESQSTVSRHTTTGGEYQGITGNSLQTYYYRGRVSRNHSLQSPDILLQGASIKESQATVSRHTTTGGEYQGITVYSLQTYYYRGRVSRNHSLQSPDILLQGASIKESQSTVSRHTTTGSEYQGITVYSLQTYYYRGRVSRNHRLQSPDILLQGASIKESQSTVSRHTTTGGEYQGIIGYSLQTYYYRGRVSRNHSLQSPDILLQGASIKESQSTVSRHALSWDVIF